MICAMLESNLITKHIEHQMKYLNLKAKMVSTTILYPQISHYQFLNNCQISQTIPNQFSLIKGSKIPKTYILDNK